MSEAVTTEPCCEPWDKAKWVQVKVSFEWESLLRWESYAAPSSSDAPGQLSGWFMGEGLPGVRFCPWCGVSK